MKKQYLLLALCLCLSLHASDPSRKQRKKQQKQRSELSMPASGSSGSSTQRDTLKASSSMTLSDQKMTAPSTQFMDDPSTVTTLATQPPIQRARSNSLPASLIKLETAEFWATREPNDLLLANLPLLIAGAIEDHKNAKLMSPQAANPELTRINAKAQFQKTTVVIRDLVNPRKQVIDEEIKKLKARLRRLNRISDTLESNEKVLKMARAQTEHNPGVIEGLIEQHGEHINGFSKLTKALLYTLASPVTNWWSQESESSSK